MGITTNYLAEINRFYSFLRKHPGLSSNARLLWHVVMQRFNDLSSGTEWPEELEIKTCDLQSMTDLSKKSVERARDELEEADLIKVIHRRGRQSPVYSFVRHTDAQRTGVEGHTDAQADAQLPIARPVEGHTDAQADAQPIPLNKTTDEKTLRSVDVDVRVRARKKKYGGQAMKPETLEQVKAAWLLYYEREPTEIELGGVETCFKIFMFAGLDEEKSFPAEIGEVLKASLATEVYNMAGYLTQAFKNIYEDYLPGFMRKDAP